MEDDEDRTLQRSLSAPVMRRRTFTTNQFLYGWRPSYQRTTGEAFREKRPSSVNRHNNPHPMGLTRQAPYNKADDKFGFWQPSMNLILKALPEKLSKSHNQNFTTGHLEEKVKTETDYGDLANVPESPKFQSYAALSFQAPRERTESLDRSVPISRYGSHACRMSSASGIVPNALTQWQTDRRRKPPSNHTITLHKSF